MGELISAEKVKELWPVWQALADSIQITGQTSDNLLELAITLAEQEWGDYMTLTVDEMTDSLTRHLMHLVRYQLYLLKHGDKALSAKDKPRIVADYETTIGLLKDGALGSGLIDMAAKPRRMHRWFTDSGEEDLVSSLDDDDGSPYPVGDYDPYD
jgi:hypothetical protein